jgi:hypothetical protein
MIVISCFEENLQLFLLSLSIKAYLPRQAVFGFSALLQECVFSKRIILENRKGGFRDDQKDRLFCGKTGRLLFPVLFNSDFFFGFCQKAGCKRGILFSQMQALADARCFRIRESAFLRSQSLSLRQASFHVLLLSFFALVLKTAWLRMQRIPPAAHTVWFSGEIGLDALKYFSVCFCFQDAE